MFGLELIELDIPDPEMKSVSEPSKSSSRHKEHLKEAIDDEEEEIRKEQEEKANATLMALQAVDDQFEQLLFGLDSASYASSSYSSCYGINKSTWETTKGLGLGLGVSTVQQEQEEVAVQTATLSDASSAVTTSATDFSSSSFDNDGVLDAINDYCCYYLNNNNNTNKHATAAAGVEGHDFSWSNGGGSDDVVDADTSYADTLNGLSLPDVSVMTEHPDIWVSDCWWDQTRTSSGMVKVNSGRSSVQHDSGDDDDDDGFHVCLGGRFRVRDMPPTDTNIRKQQYHCQSQSQFQYQQVQECLSSSPTNPSCRFGMESYFAASATDATATDTAIATVLSPKAKFTYRNNNNNNNMCLSNNSSGNKIDTDIVGIDSDYFDDCLFNSSSYSNNNNKHGVVNKHKQQQCASRKLQWGRQHSADAYAGIGGGGGGDVFEGPDLDIAGYSASYSAGGVVAGGVGVGGVIGKRISKASVAILTRWLLQNKENPYPTLHEKKQLGRQAGLSAVQVSNWMTNMRKRHVLPVLRGYKNPKTDVHFSFLSSVSSSSATTTSCTAPDMTIG